MNITGIVHLNNKAYLQSVRFHSVEPLPATITEVRAAIDEALNHLDELHKVLDNLIFDESGSMIESDKIIKSFPNGLVGNITNSNPTGNSGRPEHKLDRNVGVK